MEFFAISKANYEDYAANYSIIYWEGKLQSISNFFKFRLCRISFNSDLYSDRIWCISENFKNISIVLNAFFVKLLVSFNGSKRTSFGGSEHID